MIGTTLASAARPFWRVLELYDLDPAFVFREAGLDPALMDKPRERYKLTRRVAAWSKASELIGDPCFGLKIAEVWSPTDLHALGYAFLASSTLRTGLRRLARYVHVINDGVAFDLEDDGTNVRFALKAEHPALQSPLPAAEDSVWAQVTSMCRVSFGDHLDPVELTLLHAEPPCAGAYYGLFRCPIRFGAASSSILFASKDVDRPLPAANKELARANDRILADFLDRRSDDDLTARVKAAIAEQLPSGSPSDEEIAKSVYMSPRTLQRKLSASGTSYSVLLDAVRHELAARYIEDPSLTLSEISYLLGFSELSAFSRAFRRWTGQAPSTARSAAGA